MAKTATLIPIACTGTEMVDLELLEEFQGNFKTLPDSEGAKLKGQLKTLGICEPFVCWRDGDRVRVIDGHQRLRVMREMLAEAYRTGKMPALLGPAQEKEAKP